MSDKDSDKTQINPFTGLPSKVDVTRIKKNESSQDDATRIAPPSKQPAEDQTILAEPTKAGEDVTQFNPAPVDTGDKTRFNPKTKVNQKAIGQSDAAASAIVGEHDVLKDRFVLEKVLGAGGMGVVYKARDLLKVEAQDRDPYVAIKVLSEEFKTHPEAFISLQRESRKSQRIAHPNIVNVHDFDRDGDTVFMTMEYMEGTPLDELIRQYKATGLPTEDAWEIINGMSRALAHAHGEKIIHSDFKPGNVFVTNKGQAKVFDFGIARAVAIAEHSGVENPEDKTIFDAGNLGALTPAYASLEMLQGKQPDVRDDIFALGCVAYEMLTGTHPYGKVPADEAERQKLKPKRIPNIKKFQWKTIQKAISLHRKDRVESVEKFLHGISPKIKTTNRLAAVLAVLLVGTGSAGYYFYQQSLIDPYAEFDIRDELELKIRIDLLKENLETLLGDPNFSETWQEEVWKDVSALMKLTKGEDQWVLNKRRFIYQLYLKEIEKAIKGYKLKYATSLVELAPRYSDNPVELDKYKQMIAAAYQRIKNQQAVKDQDAEKQRLAELERQKRAQQQKAAAQASEAKQKEVFEKYNIALDNVNELLKCQTGLNMNNLRTSVEKLRELDFKRYKKSENRIITELGSCISLMGEVSPARATEAKKQALRLFPDNQLLASISIKQRDPCDVSLAGLGARGKRATCKDKLKDNKVSPEMVVIPASGKIKAFAIGKYEVTIGELNAFCSATNQCGLIKNRDSKMPASKVTVSTAKAYLKWLSEESGQRYRLPTKNEWLYAAKSRRTKLDANRNCKLNTRGIEKGGELVLATIGSQNSWGLVNYVGNVQEWAYDSGRKLVALGGSYQVNLEDCVISTHYDHTGNPDSATGFRVVREIRQG